MKHARLALLVAIAALGLARIARDEILAGGETRASDALPLYLYGAAAAEGLDPTRPEALAQVYDARHMDVGAATFSTLYPATAGPLFRPLAALPWDTFTTVWRWLLLAGIAAYGPIVAWRAGWTWGAATVAVLAWHPVAAETVRLGQVNLLLGVVCALAIVATAKDRALPAGVALAVGALVKLVPGALALPLLASRRVRGPLVLAAVGAVGLALTMPLATVPRVVEAVRETLRFQAAIDPDWLVGRARAPEWMRVLGFLRHDALQWITLGAAILVPYARPSRDTTTAAMAALCAWLGADAAGFHVLYAPLAWPVFAWAAGRPLPFAIVAVAFHALAWAPGLADEPKMVLAGLVAWAVAMAALLAAGSVVAPAAFERDRPFKQGLLTALGLATGAILAGSLPGRGPAGPPLPAGQTAPEGPGFIHPGDRAPGEVRALGAGLDRPASTLAKPGTIRALQLYLRRAPGLWRDAAARYPARAEALEARAKAVPAGELRDVSGRQMGAFLREEEAAIRGFEKDGLDLGELPRMLEEALASGLTETPSAE